MTVFERLDALPPLSPEERQLLDSVKALSRDEIKPRAAEDNRPAAFPWDNIRAITVTDPLAVTSSPAIDPTGRFTQFTAICNLTNHDESAMNWSR